MPRLAPGAEFDRIRAIAASLGKRAEGLGDDCALVPLGHTTLAISIDISVENVHFRRGYMTPHEIGWRAAAGALSDLAAVGARPVGVLASLVLPASTSEADTVLVMDGIAEAADSVGGKVLGGDLAAGPVWTIDLAVLGQADTPVRRSGAMPGDELWVTGWLGGARAGLLGLEAKRSPGAQALAAFLRPQPRVVAGSWLARHGASAMIDLSDGLAGDVWHLAAASGVSIQVDLDRVPIGAGVQEEAARLSEDPRQFAARGGEDYELLVALPPGIDAQLLGELQEVASVPLTRIGSVGAGEGVRFLLDGRDVSLHGYDHFRPPAGPVR